MKKNIIASHIIVALLFINNYLFSQEIIKLKFIDSDNHKLLQNVKVIVQNEKNYSKFTNDSGCVTFSNLHLDTNRIEIKAFLIGYQVYTNYFNLQELSNKTIIIHLSPLNYGLKSVTVSCYVDKNKFDDVLNSINKQSGKNLQKDLSNSLAMSMRNQVGVAIRSMGPAPARPVIRGLNGNRIELAEDGQSTNDLSATSPDHATTIEPYTIESIEIVRGPKLLMYTPVAIGGFVNVIRNDIISSKLFKPNIQLGSFYESINNSNAEFINVKLPITSFNLNFEALRKKSDDMKIHNEKFKNTNISNYAFAFSTSYIFDNGFVGFGFRKFNSSYGVPGGVVGTHPNGVDIDMGKNNYSFKFAYELDNRNFRNITIDLSRTYYHHTEYEAKNVVGAEFLSLKYDSKINLNYFKIFGIDNGDAGISLNYRDFKVGGYVFTPFVRSYNLAFYNFNNIDLRELNLQFSYRLNYDTYKPNKNSFLRPEYLKNRDYLTYSLAFSAIYNITPEYNLGIMLSKSSRVPSIEELYSEGPHLAAYSYEIGNPNLKDENGYGVEIISSYKKDNFEFITNLYNYYLSSFIATRNTGKTNYQTLLPIYQTDGNNAVIRGTEVSIKYNLFENISISSNLSYTYGKNISQNLPLPAIAPLKNVNQINWKNNYFIIIVTNENVLKQNRTDLFELPTSGYNIWNFSVNSSFYVGKIYSDLYISIDNIFNAVYYNHLSRLKMVMPEPGRNFRVNYKIYF
ncbi:MAG TPA: TonB-dependent receptor [Ignavibacteriales bacterium]|nr:TonB-dependent receptor [Ignavibacteriales bacterium]